MLLSERLSKKTLKLPPHSQRVWRKWNPHCPRTNGTEIEEYIRSHQLVFRLGEVGTLLADDPGCLGVALDAYEFTEYQLLSILHHRVTPRPRLHLSVLLRLKTPTGPADSALK